VPVVEHGSDGEDEVGETGHAGVNALVRENLREVVARLPRTAALRERVRPIAEALSCSEVVLDPNPGRSLGKRHENPRRPTQPQLTFATAYRST
jgi:hypothetical protein